jgi:hypothetical protein
MWEASGHDSSQGQCVERMSPQEEGKEVGCYAHVVAEVTTRGKAHFCGERRPRTEKGKIIVRITYCELSPFRGPENLKNWAERIGEGNIRVVHFFLILRTLTVHFSIG